MGSENLWPEIKVEATSGGPLLSRGISGTENRVLVTSVLVSVCLCFLLLFCLVFPVFVLGD